ncbi:acyl carrier protein [Paracoccaceae bacterium]|nr:acyl carrier protein [Paracoccaceae bacterium]
MDSKQEVLPNPRKVLSDMLRVNQNTIKPESRLGDLPGWDSLSHVSVLLELEKVYGIKVSRQAYEKCSTMSGIIEFLGEKGVTYIAD